MGGALGQEHGRTTGAVNEAEQDRSIAPGQGKIGQELRRRRPDHALEQPQGRIRLRRQRPKTLPDAQTPVLSP
jgi:hypothetical protein